ncbi:MAG: glycosyltransferase family 2 protein [Acidobacteria bacterium]|nr:glycosyltransferase family 2 protein [Acidobacteriota bacterium]
MQPAASVVIITFNSAEHVEACLRSLADPAWERIVVDNASADDTVARARGMGGTVVLANPENRGFAAAANQGIQAARGELVLLLNPDVAAERGALEALRAAVAPERIGAAGGRLLNPDGSTQAGFTARRLPTLATAVAEILLLNRFFPGNRWNRRYRCLDLDYERAAEIEQPPGACLLVKRRAWEAVGGFDEQFFPLWFEDVDFCRRLRASGWRIVYEPRARFRHAGGHSVARLSPRQRQLFWYCNLLRYFRKHHGRGAALALRGAIFAGMLLRLGATLVGGQPADASRRAYLQAYAQVVRHCVFGRGEAARNRMESGREVQA